MPPWWLWLLLIVVAALTLVGWAGWRGWQLWQADQQARQQQLQTLQSQLKQARGEINTLRSNLSDASDSASRDSRSIAALQGRVNDVERSVDTLGNVVRGGRQRVQLDVVEQLLLSANDQVQLAHDPVVARRALEAADDRLAALDSPRLFALRKEISEEQAALKKVDEPDLTATSLALSQLIDSVPQLPLRDHPHPLDDSAPAPDAGAAGNTDRGWFSRGWHRIGSALRSLFHLRRTDHPIEPMLTAAQEPLVGEVLTLRLDTARAALVQRHTAVYRNALTSAQHWLQHYYRVQDPAVGDAVDQLTKLSAIDLDPTLPDISHSLDLLRDVRNGQGN